jgi:hypothetical protein
MKKIITASLEALALVSTSISANAATAKPTIKKPAAAAKEGTAAHESSETGETQKKEAAPSKKATATKKPAAKPTKKATK